jgi:hypothetical protein
MAIHRSKYTGRIKVRTGYDAIRGGPAERREIKRFGCPQHWLYNPGLFTLDLSSPNENLMKTITNAPVYEPLRQRCLQWLADYRIHLDSYDRVNDHGRCMSRGYLVPMPQGFRMELDSIAVKGLIPLFPKNSSMRSYISEAELWQRCGYKEGRGPHHLPFHAPYGYSDDDIVKAVREESRIVAEERNRRRSAYADRYGEEEAHRMFGVTI